MLSNDAAAVDKEKSDIEGMFICLARARARFAFVFFKNCVAFLSISAF